MAEDAAVLLADFVSSLDNLPSEVDHILQEIGHKEQKAHEIRLKATTRDQSIQKHCRPANQGGQGLLVPNPKEESLIAKIRYANLEASSSTCSQGHMLIRLSTISAWFCYIQI